MGDNVIVNERYVAEYYEKRKKLNELQIEVELMSNNIKNDILKNRTPIGRSYGKYSAHLVTKYKLKDEFILMLKNNNMQDRIKEVCQIKDCKDIVETLTDAEKKKYMDEWYKQLFVSKKHK